MGQEHGEVQQAGGGQDVRRELQQEPGELYTGKTHTWLLMYDARIL